MVCSKYGYGQMVNFNQHTHILPPTADHSTHCDIVTADIVEQLIGEIGKIKTQQNNTELQLYEANEKMADIIENVWRKRLAFVCVICI